MNCIEVRQSRYEPQQRRNRLPFKLVGTERNFKFFYLVCHLWSLFYPMMNSCAYISSQILLDVLHLYVGLVFFWSHYCGDMELRRSQDFNSQLELIFVASGGLAIPDPPLASPSRHPGHKHIAPAYGRLPCKRREEDVQEVYLPWDVKERLASKMFTHTWLYTQGKRVAYTVSINLYEVCRSSWLIHS